MRNVESSPAPQSSQRRLVDDELWTVVVGLDFGVHGEDALWFAQNLARGNPSATVHLVHVVSPPVGVVGVLGAPVDVSTSLTASLERAREELDRACMNVPPWLEGRIAGHVRTGDPGREITALARELDADLIVVGTHGRTGLGRILLGSLAENIMRHASCSVLVAHAPTAHASVPLAPASTERVGH